MDKFIKLFSIFTFIWSSAAILNGFVLFVTFIVYSFHLKSIYWLDNSSVLEFFFGVQVVLTAGMIAFICFLQSLWILRQLKNRS